MNGSKLDQKRNGIKLVLRIFENIVENPNEIKYRNLNANRVFKKLQQCNELRQLLLESGFKTSNDGKRLIFDTTKTININHLKNKLKDRKNTKITDLNILESNTLCNVKQGKCKLSNCKHLQRISRILQIYHLYTEYNNKYYETKQKERPTYLNIANIYKNNYNNTDLLNDYNHMLFQHESNGDFEYIHHKLYAETAGKF
eukprot:261862_1